jgi:hypothetical protein
MENGGWRVRIGRLQWWRSRAIRGSSISMKRSHSFAALVAVLLAAESSTLFAEEAAISLFDGKSLSGWTTAGGESVKRGWTVEDGMLVRASRGGSIFTEKEYGDFDLRFEWKIAPRGNSGIKYRVAFFEKGVRGNPGLLGCEYQLFDDVGRSTGPEHSCGALYALYAPSADKQLRPVGEFNESRIVVRGSTIEHWLNGAKVVEADTNSDDWKRRIADSKFHNVAGFAQNPKGRIELQDHGHKVWFRSMVLRPLDAK